MSVLLLLYLFSCCYSASIFSFNPITVKDSHGSVISSFSTQQHQKQETLYPHIDEFPVKWDLTPKIKEVVMWVDGSIIVYTKSIVPRTTFTISASTSTGNYTLPFDIEVHGCDYGYFTYLTGSAHSIDIFSGTSLVYNGTTDSVFLCIPRGDYHFTAPGTETFYFAVMDDNNTHFYTAHYDGFGTPVEGSFSNDIDKPIEIRVPSVISVLSSLDKTFYLDVKGPVRDISFEPQVRFNPVQYTIQLSTHTAVTNYTITASYGSQIVTSTFTVYKGICPEDRTLIEVKDSGVSFSLPTVETNAPYTYRQSFCVEGESFVVNTLPFDDGVLLILKNGDIFYERRFINETSFSSFTVQFHSFFSFSSPLQVHVGSAPKRWAEVKFNGKWGEGYEGAFGSFDASAVAQFRGVFTLSDAFVFSMLILHLRGEGDATLFVDGMEFTQVVLGANSTSVAIPSSFVTSGTNVIAVLLHKGKSSTITFGMSLEASNTPRIPLTDGVATAVQSVSVPKHSPEKAFQLLSCEDSSWIGSGDAELVFSFNHARQRIHRIEAMVEEGLYQLQVIGVTGDEKAVLGSFNGANAFELKKGIVIGNTRPVDSVRFVFSSSQPNRTIAVSCVGLYAQSLYSCPKRIGTPSAIEGNSFYKKCPLGSTGRRVLSCQPVARGAEWNDDRSQCYPVNPQRGFVFLDWFFTVYGMTASQWGEKQKEMTLLLAENMYLKVKDIQYMYADFAIDGENMTMKVFSRCCVESVYGQALKYDFNKLIPQFSQLVADKMGTAYSASIDDVILRKYVNWFVLILVSLLVLVLLAAIGIFFSVRFKKGEMKRLIPHAKGEREVLLS